MNWAAFEGNGSVEMAARMEKWLVRTEAERHRLLSKVLKNLAWNNRDIVDSSAKWLPVKLDELQRKLCCFSLFKKKRSSTGRGHASR
jgi:hypothetical protein